MKDAFLRSIAERHHIPLPLAHEIAAEVAQRCALVANRYEPEGMFTFEQLAGVEAIGAKIGAAIIETFSEP
jgi:hypothetical protein